MDPVSLYVSVPICSFRKPYAREYLETERVPPPATVYGFLLSLVGEEDRWKYAGTRIAIAVLSTPLLSTVLRTTWRVKNKSLGPGLGSNRRPDYQEILTGIEMAVWVASGEVADRLVCGMSRPAGIERYGGLCLGESRDLVDQVKLRSQFGDRNGTWLALDQRGRYPLPIWVDHVGTAGTRWEQFTLQEAPLETPAPEDMRWITIRPPEIEHV